MISLLTYKIFHLVAMFIFFAAAGGVAIYAANGGTREDNRLRKPVSLLHGLALVVLLVSGFGMLARLGIKHDWIFPGWLWIKLVIYLLLGGIALLPYRKPELGRIWLWLLPLLGGVSAYLALYKPF